MFWFIAAISALVAAMLVNGLIHQERLRLWNFRQQQLAEQNRQQIEEKKRQAGEKVKVLLRDRRGDSDNSKGVDAETAMKNAVAEMSAAIQAEQAQTAAAN